MQALLPDAGVCVHFSTGANRRGTSFGGVAALLGRCSSEDFIATAMQQYGLILADIGSAMYVTGSSASENASNGIGLRWNLDDIFASWNSPAGRRTARRR